MNEAPNRRRGAATSSAALPMRRSGFASLSLPWQIFVEAWEKERDERRLFLWLPVSAGAGVLLYLAADSEPVFWLPALLCTGLCAAAYVSRARRLSFSVLMMLAAMFFGFLCAEARSWRVAAPVLDRIRIFQLTGQIEEVDIRRSGARFLLHVTSAAQSNGAPMPAEITPYYIRLSQKKALTLQAGDMVTLKARLLPPAHASIPSGYDFARTAYFSRIGAVGSVLGAMEISAMPPAGGFLARAMQALDRGRNRLALRVDAIIGGDEGAVAAAMVAGKRSLLSENAQEIIREAGIFHIITISGVQMTLVAGMMFWLTRRILSLFDGLSLRFPTKKIAAFTAILCAIFYDIATGSRVGTERALFMTLIVLGSVLVDRSALTMRNLALAALAVIILEPEAITGASFQLSFAAVATLIAVHEARYARPGLDEAEQPVRQGRIAPAPSLVYVQHLAARAAHHVSGLLIATLCATAATASFMASDFHDLSPYVLIGNPLTLVIIEFFAVPGALIGTLLYPLGLDAPVWLYVGLGIKLVFWMAKIIGSAPGSTLHLHAFAVWTLPCLALGVLNMVIWRSWALRTLATPCFALGALGIWTGAPFDIAIPPTGDYAAWRGSDGKLQIAGKHPGTFGATQWLAADADGRTVPEAKTTQQNCDRMGCVSPMPNGKMLAIVTSPQSFEEDCARASIVISPLKAPENCPTALVFDQRRLTELGAVTLRYDSETATSERQPYTNRPWSPQPRQQIARITPEAATQQSKRPDPAASNKPVSPPTPDDDLLEQIENGMTDGDL